MATLLTGSIVRGGTFWVDGQTLVQDANFFGVTVRATAPDVKDLQFAAVVFDQCDLRGLPGWSIIHSVFIDCDLPLDALGTGNNIVKPPALV